MLGVLVLLFILCWILTGDIRFQKKKECLKSRAGTETATIIKYDKYSVGILRILTIMLVVMLVGSWMLTSLKNFRYGDVFVLIFVCSSVLLIVFGEGWIAGALYLKKLRKYGYTIPEKKADYGYILEKLPRTGEQIQQSPYSKISKGLAVACVCILVCMLAVNAWYYYSWRFMEDSAKSMLVMLIIGDIYWLIQAIYFRKQMSNEKYKEDVEIDASRRDRMSLGSGILLILVMLLVTWFVKDIAFNMTKYTYNAWVDTDRTKAGQIQEVLHSVYLDFKVNGESYGNWEATRHSLEAGVDITDWGVPQDVYQCEVAEWLDISDFCELKDDFRSVTEDAILFALLEDDGITLSLPNLPIEVSSPIIIKPSKKTEEE